MDSQNTDGMFQQYQSLAVLLGVIITIVMLVAFVDRFYNQPQCVFGDHVGGKTVCIGKRGDGVDVNEINRFLQTAAWEDLLKKKAVPNVRRTRSLLKSEYKVWVDSDNLLCFDYSVPVYSVRYFSIRSFRQIVRPANVGESAYAINEYIYENIESSFVRYLESLKDNSEADDKTAEDADGSVGVS